MSQSEAAVIAPRSLGGLLLPVFVLFAVTLVWQTVVVVWEIHPILLPSPVLCRLDADRWSPELAELTRGLPYNSVLSAGWKIRSDLMLGCGRTAAAAGAGLAMSTLAGILLAFLFSQSAIIRRALYPYAVLLQTIPIIAIAPIVIVAFGRGFFSVSLVAAVISLFPIVTSTTTGLLQIDPNLLDLFRLSGATRLQTLLKLRVPSSLPFLMSGIRIASGSAIVGAIVGEFFVGSSQPGLGAMIQMKANSALDMSELYATVLTSTFVGTVSFGAVTVVGEAILRRWFGMSISGQR